LRALEACAAAIARRPALPEAIYNKALALEALQLQHEAAAAWERYLRIDPASSWSEVASRHLRDARRALDQAGMDRYQPVHRLLAAALEAGTGAKQTSALTAVVSTRPDVARLYGLEVFLGHWALAAQRGQPKLAAELLAAAQCVGVALARQRGDLLLMDSVAAIQSAAGQPPRLDLLVRGHALFLQALSLEKQESFAAAGPRFAEAADALRRANSPFAALATLHLGVCQYYGARYKEALASIETAAGQFNPVRYAAEVGYRFWMSGLIHYLQADLQRALTDHRLALERFTAEREPPHIAFVAAFIAGDLYSLGQHEESWRYRLRSLANVSQLGDTRRVYSVFMAAAESALGDRWLASARLFMSELIDCLGDGASHGLLAEAFARRGVLDEASLDSRAARLDIASARSHLPGIADPLHRNRVAADLDLAEGQVLRAHDPRRAIALLDRARAYFAPAGLRINSGQALQERAAAYRASGRPQAAAQDLNEAIVEYERHRGDLSNEALRIAYFEQVQGIFDEMVKLQLFDLRRPDSAFLYAERSRARALLDRVQLVDGGLEESAASMAAFTRTLQPGVRIVEFAALAGQTIAWTVKRDGLASTVLAGGATPLAEAVHRFREETRSGMDHPPAERELYSLLIAPLRPTLEGASTLVFVPDKALDELPFAALRDPATGRFLIEDFSIAVAPSSAIYLSSLARERGLPPGGRQSLLLVEGDGFDRGAFASLAPLAGARQEIGFLASLYPNTASLAGAAAAKDRVLHALETSDVAQISAHTAPDPRLAGGSALVLAPQAGSNPASARYSLSADGLAASLLGASDLQARDLHRLRLAILAACGTASGAGTTREGAFSVARGFLAAGVPAVVATLWEIDDQAAGAFIRALHQRLARGADPLSALRATQLAFLRQPTPTRPALWAAFELIGGVADRNAPPLSRPKEGGSR
jgi:CHAT domain-containing protein